MMTDMVGNSGISGLTRAQQIEVIARRHFRFLEGTEREKVDFYLRCAEELLRSKEFVQGSEFRAYAGSKGLTFEERNSWASCVTALRRMGLIRGAGKEESNDTHNHGYDVTVWKSALFVGGSSETDLEKLLA